MPISSGVDLNRWVKSQALETGFNLAAIATASPAPGWEFYQEWIAAGYHGEMAYLSRLDRLERRRDLSVILPGAQSMILVGLNYATAANPPRDQKTRGSVSRYAWGGDYHALMGEMHEELISRLRAEHPEAKFKSYADTGAVMEKSHAAAAGMGFYGKNGLLISPRFGSYFFIGEIVTDLLILPDERGKMPTCGTCRRCIDACPTGAITAPGVVDARLCVSYLTIEHRGEIPRGLRQMMGMAVYGCDICQEVCPWNRFAHPTDRSGYFAPPAAERMAPSLASLLTLDDKGFMDLFADSPVRRTGRERLVRNACVAAGNSGDHSLLPLLTNLAEGPNSLIASHARWAIEKIGDEG